MEKCGLCKKEVFASLMDYEVMEIKQDFKHVFFCCLEHLVEYYSKQFTKDPPEVDLVDSGLLDSEDL